jgi:CheY-like chemotaxis protein
MSLTVLHLEDISSLRDMLRSTLNVLHPGCILHEFSNSDDAQAFIERAGATVDLFLLDMRVPGVVDGLGVAQQIHDLGYPGVVIVTSAYRPPDQGLLETLQARWLHKPWQIDDIRELLRLAAEHRANP